MASSLCAVFLGADEILFDMPKKRAEKTAARSLVTPNRAAAVRHGSCELRSGMNQQDRRADRREAA
jgi:hypothetical protein